MSSSTDPSTVEITAVVAAVKEKYIVAYPKQGCGDLTVRDSVTVTLSDWLGSDVPQHGQVIQLINTSLYVEGWRARNARPVTPQSERQGVVATIRGR